MNKSSYQLVLKKAFYQGVVVERKKIDKSADYYLGRRNHFIIQSWPCRHFCAKLLPFRVVFVDFGGNK